MSRYFELTDAMTSTRWHLGEVKKGDGSEVDLDRCRRLGNTEELSLDVTHTGRVLEYCTTSFNAPIASQRVASAIREVAKDDVQCIPVEIAGQDGFVLINALREVRCIDDTRSEFIKWTDEDGRPDKVGKYRQVSRLDDQPAAVPEGTHMFRPWGWLVALIVSAELRAAMERVGCDGAEFRDVMPR